MTADGTPEFRIGCNVLSLLMIAATVITGALGGSWWVPAVCTVLVSIAIYGPLYLLALGLFSYFTWGTWWLMAPLALFVLGAWRTKRAESGALRLRGLKALEKYVRTGNPRALQRSVALHRAAVANVAPYDLDRALYPANLSGALLALYERNGQASVLEEAIQLCRDILVTVPPDHRHRVVCLTGLGSALMASYGKSEDPAVLQEAVLVYREAVAAPHDGSERAPVLANLGGALLSLLQQGQEPTVLEEAVGVLRDALSALPSGHPYRNGFLGNLGVALMLSYAQSGELGALEEAVRINREALAATPLDYPQRDGFLSNFGGALLCLFERNGKTAVLEEAVGVFRDALAACPPDHPRRHSFLTNLAAAMWGLWQRDERSETAQETVQLLREALATTPDDDPKRVGRLLNLSGALLTSFTADREPEALEEAVRLSREALAATPVNHMDRADCLRAVGDALRMSFERTGDRTALTEARHAFAAAARIASAPTSNRVTAARKAADLDLLAGDHDHAVAMVELAVAQVPLVASRQLGRDDRQHRAVGLAGLASTAAAAAIAAGNPGRAVELLELTRGIVLASTFDTRSDLTELRRREPSLARELHDLHEAIDDADHTPNLVGAEFVNPLDHRQLAELRARLNKQLSELLTRIRQRPGLDGFLRPPPIDLLRTQAVDGPIVYVTTHTRSSHALIVTDDLDQPVHVVDLPGLTPDTAKEQADLLRSAQRTAGAADLPASERRAAQEQILRILGRLWDTVTEPVLRHLGHTATHSGKSPWPRIWWCATGICAFLPLHAAGHHTPGSTETVMDRVVSSYTPTIRALSHARVSRPLTASALSMVILAVPNAPHTSPLPGATRESELLQRLIPAVTTLTSPGHNDVTTALPNYRIAHFACHSLGDSGTPANSRLLLTDHLERPFTISAVARMRLDRAELAYLSACSTTDTTYDHADEAVHITAAFQLAGYRNVIGTLWPVNDHAAIGIAEAFYTHLTSNGTVAPDPTSGAVALHHATRQHRTRRSSLPTQWAAHIHTGP